MARVLLLRPDSRGRGPREYREVKVSLTSDRKLLREALDLSPEFQ